MSQSLSSQLSCDKLDVDNNGQRLADGAQQPSKQPVNAKAHLLGRDGQSSDVVGTNPSAVDKETQVQSKGIAEEDTDKVDANINGRKRIKRDKLGDSAQIKKDKDKSQISSLPKEPMLKKNRSSTQEGEQLNVLYSESNLVTLHQPLPSISQQNLPVNMEADPSEATINLMIKQPTNLAQQKHQQKVTQNNSQVESNTKDINIETQHNTTQQNPPNKQHPRVVIGQITVNSLEQQSQKPKIETDLSKGDHQMMIKVFNQDGVQIEYKSKAQLQNENNPIFSTLQATSKNNELIASINPITTQIHRELQSSLSCNQPIISIPLVKQANTSVSNGLTGTKVSAQFIEQRLKELFNLIPVDYQASMGQFVRYLIVEGGSVNTNTAKKK